MADLFSSISIGNVSHTLAPYILPPPPPSRHSSDGAGDRSSTIGCNEQILAIIKVRAHARVWLNGKLCVLITLGGALLDSSGQAVSCVAGSVV